MSKRVPVKRVHKDHKSGPACEGVIQPILYPGKRTPDTNGAILSDKNMLITKNPVL